MPSQRKEMGIPLGILPHVQKQKNIPTSLGRINPNTLAAGNQTQRLAWHQATTRTQADLNSVCPRRNPGVRTAPGQTPGIVRTLCRPFQAFRWCPIHKPSSMAIAQAVMCASQPEVPTQRVLSNHLNVCNDSFKRINHCQNVVNEVVNVYKVNKELVVISCDSQKKRSLAWDLRAATGNMQSYLVSRDRVCDIVLNFHGWVELISYTAAVCLLSKGPSIKEANPISYLSTR